MSRRQHIASVGVEELLAAIQLPLDRIADEVGCSVATLYRLKKNPTKRKAPLLRALRGMVADRLREDGARFRFIDLFSGIGGMRIAAEAVGGRCVFSCERDKWARQTYLKNFPDTLGTHTEEEITRVFPRDITTVEPDQIPPYDLLLAGFPCQPFSIAGVSKKNALGRPHGFRCQEQGNLFFDVAEIIDRTRPAAFVLENVKNLERHDGGKTFRIIRDTLEKELGYQVITRVIDAKPFVPQHRERILIAGFREPTAFTFDDLHLPPKQQWPRLTSILHRPSEHPDGRYTVQERNRTRVSDKYTLTDHLWGYLQDYKRKHEAAGNGFGFGLFKAGGVARTLSARYFKDGSEILISQGDRKNPRRLTPRECARLMGFPKDFVIEVSDTQAYRQFGNSVVVPVIASALALMLPHLLRIIEGEQLGLPIAAAHG